MEAMGNANARPSVAFAKYTQCLCVKYYRARLEDLSVTSFMHTCLKQIKLGVNFTFNAFQRNSQ